MADRENPLARLEHELRAPAPPGLRSLDPDQIDHLAGSVAAARHRQAAAIAAAGEHGLRFVPRLLRVPVRKAFGG